MLPQCSGENLLNSMRLKVKTIVLPNNYPIFKIKSQVGLPEGDVASDVVMAPAGDILESNLSSNPSSKMMLGSSRMVAVASNSNLLEPATSNQLDLSGNHSSEEEVNFSSIKTAVIVFSFSFVIIGMVINVTIVNIFISIIIIPVLS